MQSILIICGPTATGKTELGLDLAQELNGQLISADSRQVYIDMDIGTGKDKPEGKDIWLYDVARPTDDFNVNTYYQLATQAIDRCAVSKKLPIIVGGTGFYIKSLLEPPQTLTVPINPDLRSQLNNLSTDALQQQLRHLDPQKWITMNNSDRQNPRRLVRAIEVAGAVQKPTKYIYDAKIIGLRAPQEVLNDRIKKRIESRLNQGFEAEVKNLLKKYPLWPESQSSHTPGYIQWIKYLRGESSKEVALKEWYFDEIQYARRQMTWFSKEKNIQWFDITTEGWYANIQLWLNPHITSKSL